MHTRGHINIYVHIYRLRVTVNITKKKSIPFVICTRDGHELVMQALRLHKVDRSEQKKSVVL